MLDISYRDHITNDVVRNRIRQAIGPNDILTTVKKTQVRVVWDLTLDVSSIKISRARQDNFTNSARREKKGPTKEALGEQHL